VNGGLWRTNTIPSRTRIEARELDRRHVRCGGALAVSLKLLACLDACGYRHEQAISSSVPRRVRGLACTFNFDDVAPGVGLAAVEIGEAVLLREGAAG